MADISNYLDFIITTCTLTGIIFQIPLVIKIIVKFDLIKKEKLKKKRKLIIVLSFIVGMLLTPPDVILQVMLALPIILLFELGLLIS